MYTLYHIHKLSITRKNEGFPKNQVLPLTHRSARSATVSFHWRAGGNHSQHMDLPWVLPGRSWATHGLVFRKSFNCVLPCKVEKDATRSL